MKNCRFCIVKMVIFGYMLVVWRDRKKNIYRQICVCMHACIVSMYRSTRFFCCSISATSDSSMHAMQPTPTHLLSRYSRKALPFLVWVHVRPVTSILCVSIRLSRYWYVNLESAKSTGPINTFERSTTTDGKSTSAASFKVSPPADRHEPKMSTASFVIFYFYEGVCL